MTVEIHQEKLRGLNVTSERLRLELAVGLFASEELPLGQASEIAGVSQTQFLRELGRRSICVHYGVEEFEEDLRTLESLKDS